MIVLSAGCASLASLMQRDADGRCELESKRASIATDRRPCLISTNDADQRAVRVSPARQIR